jgi:hypothetical protein
VPRQQPVTVLDQDLSLDEFRRRSADLALRFAAALGVADVDAQYALLASRLTGDRRIAFDDHLDIRMRCWPLLIERNPKLTADAIQAILMQTAKDLGPRGRDEEFSAGLVDAYEALLTQASAVAQQPPTR